jgi:hypothetical protein
MAQPPPPPPPPPPASLLPGGAVDGAMLGLGYAPAPLRGAVRMSFPGLPLPAGAQAAPLPALSLQPPSAGVGVGVGAPQLQAHAGAGSVDASDDGGDMSASGKRGAARALPSSAGEHARQQRRERHKQVEVRRRRKLGDLFQRLADTLGCGLVDKASVLSAALHELARRQASLSLVITPAAAPVQGRMAAGVAAVAAQPPSDSQPPAKRRAVAAGTGSSPLPALVAGLWPPRPAPTRRALRVALESGEVMGPDLTSWVDLQRGLLVLSAGLAAILDGAATAAAAATGGGGGGGGGDSLAALMAPEDAADLERAIDRCRRGEVHHFALSVRARALGSALEMRVAGSAHGVEGQLRFVFLTWTPAAALAPAAAAAAAAAPAGDK